jgi:hypothetical protein
MSTGGRLILVNSCLSSIPTYLMGFYHLTDCQHKELDPLEGGFSGREVVPHLSIIWPNGSLRACVS